MVARVIQEKTSLQTNGHTPRKITWEEFQRKYLSREDNFKYEWVDVSTADLDTWKHTYLIQNQVVRKRKIFKK